MFYKIQKSNGSLILTTNEKDIFIPGFYICGTVELL